jgi:hypothetical protein
MYGTSTSQALKRFQSWTRLVETDRAAADEIPEAVQMVQELLMGCML